MNGCVMGSRTHTTVIPEELTGLRLDQALARLFAEYSRTSIKHWIETEKVTLNLKCVARPSHKVQAGDAVEFSAVLDASAQIEPQTVSFEVVHSDEAVIVVNKPAGVVVHPGAGNPDRTLVNGMLAVFPELAALPRAGLVHRIDKHTSGLLVAGRTSASYQSLVRAMAKRKITRVYEALLNGVLITGGTVDAAIGRDPRQRTRMRVAGNGRAAITHFRVKKRFRAHTLVEVHLETGRTHQIRVHMSSLHHPIVGDSRYGGRRRMPPAPSDALVAAFEKFPRHALHARRLAFTHPSSEQRLSFECPIPKDMAELLLSLDMDLVAAGRSQS